MNTTPPSDKQPHDAEQPATRDTVSDGPHRASRTAEIAAGLGLMLLLGAALVGVIIAQDRARDAEEARLKAATACTLGDERVLRDDIARITAVGVNAAAQQSEDGEPPAEDSPEFQQLQQDAVNILVDDILLGKAIDRLQLDIPQEDVEARWQEFLDANYQGDEALLKEELEQQGLPRDLVYHFEAEVSVARDAAFEKLTAGLEEDEARAAVADFQARAYEDFADQVECNEPYSWGAPVDNGPPGSGQGAPPNNQGPPPGEPEAPTPS